MSDGHAASNNTPPSDLALFDKMLTSTAPARSDSPPASSMSIQADLRERRARAAEDRAALAAPPSEPERPAPTAPREVPESTRRKAPVPPGKGRGKSEYRRDLERRRRRRLKKALRREEMLEMEPGELRVVGSHICAPSDSDKQQEAVPRSPMKRFADGLVKKVKGVAFSGIVYPETDSEEDGEVGGREYMMSGGMSGNDRSERGRRGKTPYKSHFREELPEVEEAVLVDQPLLGDNTQGEDGSGKTKNDKTTGEVNLQKRGKETIRLTRTHERPITGHGTVVDSESETEYYESSGPANMCVVT